MLSDIWYFYDDLCKYFPVCLLWSYAVTFWRLLEVTPSELKPFLTTERLPRAFARKVMDESATWLKLDKQIVWTIKIWYSMSAVHFLILTF